MKSRRLITYDLNSPGQNYQELYTAIKSLGDWCHCMESVWLVKTRQSVESIYRKLEDYIDPSDSLLVIDANSAFWGQLDSDDWDWINEG